MPYKHPPLSSFLTAPNDSGVRVCMPVRVCILTEAQDLSQMSSSRGRQTEGAERPIPSAAQPSLLAQQQTSTSVPYPLTRAQPMAAVASHLGNPWALGVVLVECGVELRKPCTTTSVVTRLLWLPARMSRPGSGRKI